MQFSTEREALDHLRTLIENVKQEMGSAFTGIYYGKGDPLAEHLGILIEEGSLAGGDEGRYIPKTRGNSQPRIYINSWITSRERRRFTFYHEVTHHLVRGSEEIYSFLNELAQGSELTKAIENFCNIGAAEFLIPRQQVQDVIQGRGFTIELVKTLDEQYAASLPATCIQLAQSASHACMVVLCEYGSIAFSPSGQNRLNATWDMNCQHLYVLYNSSSPSFKYKAGRYIPVPNDHLLMQAYQEKNYLYGKDRLLFKSGNGWLVDCEAMYYRNRVFGLFNSEQPHQVSKWQLSLF